MCSAAVCRIGSSIEGPPPLVSGQRGSWQGRSEIVDPRSCLVLFFPQWSGQPASQPASNDRARGHCGHWLTEWDVATLRA